MESRFSVTCQEGIARIELCGRLDATNSPAFQEELQKLMGQDISRLVFYAKDLEYISSAGLRTIIFAKQKIGKAASVYLIAAQEPVSNVIKMSGADTFMILQDTYEE
jgi:anti-anti-sigma factor